MRIKRILVALTAAGVFAATAACAPNDQASSASQGQDDQADDDNSGFDDDSNEDCDRGDQKEGDRDCGHYSSPGVWAWYYWVALGRTTTPPAGWHRPKSYSSTKSGPAPARTSTTKPSTTGTKSSTNTKPATSTNTRTSSGGGTRTSTGGSRRR